MYELIARERLIGLVRIFSPTVAIMLMYFATVARNAIPLGIRRVA
jgi:hypothetical protein